MIAEETIAGEKGFMFNCDSCSHYEFFVAEKFIDARKEASQQGWRFKLIGDEWFHFCSGRCLQKRLKEREAN